MNFTEFITEFKNLSKLNTLKNIARGVRFSKKI
jgi:hypothetical protein